MKRFVFALIAISLLSTNQTEAQNPFKKLGVDVGIITLSKGKYIEFIAYDSIQRIGSVVINIKTGHIIELINTDSVELGYNYRPDVASRWMSPDPLTEERNNWTPYNYCSNNPINRIDPDGNLDIWDPWQEKQNGAFQDESERKAWVGAHTKLYAGNKIYKANYDRVEKSTEHFKVKQPSDKVIDGGWSEKGNYSKDKNTVEPYMHVEDEAVEKTMFEETFHAGQDNYNTKNGFKQTGLESEVEVEFAAVVAGIGDDEYGIKKNCPNIVKTLSEGKPVTGDVLNKDWKGLQNVALDVYKDYSRMKPEFNSNTFYRYLNSLTKEAKK